MIRCTNALATATYGSRPEVPGLADLQPGITERRTRKDALTIWDYFLLSFIHIKNDVNPIIPYKKCHGRLHFTCIN